MTQTATRAATRAGRLAPARGDAVPHREAVIEIAGLRKSFTVRGKAVPVFQGLDARIARGSFVSIIGPSGCGKSTLLKLVAGLEKPSGGSVIFDGSEVTAPPRGMVYVFQQYTRSVFPWRTVLQNIAFGLPRAERLSRAEARARCRRYVDLVGLAGYEEHFPAQISGGMQQRVAIARALIAEPDVLLMDEPFSAVDAMTRALLQDLLVGIHATIPITILFVTHDVDEAVLLSERVISLARAPGGICDDTPIDLPTPRDQIGTRGDGRFIDLRQRLFANIFRQEKGEA